MKILLIPLILIFIPVAILFLTKKFFIKNKILPKFFRVILLIIFITSGIFISIYAMLVSAGGISERGIGCATGAVTFLYAGFFINIIGAINLLKASKLNNTKID
jgi:hypothetical protein